LDPNLNISLPIFSIHGNHDDPSGVGNLSALNVLSMAGMVNYFGQSPSIQDVTVQPILMQKGTSKVALYGLGNIREERLHRQWRSGRVKLMRPQGPQDESQEDWRECFNMFVFHQNRARHGPTSSIPEEFLDSFLDLIIWGHEHECRIIPEEYESFSIIQPGSSVATSLTAGEAEPKHVGLLTINGSDYSLDKIKLGTIRPFQFTTVALSRVEDLSPSDGKATHRYLEGVVNDLIQRAKDEWEIEHQELVSDGNSNMPAPLVRVRVDYSGGYDTFNPQQFGQKFVNRVANPSDILKFQRDRSTTQRQPRASEMMRDPTMAIPEQLDAVRVEDLAHELLADLYVVPEPGLKDAISALVDKDDKDVLKRFIKNCEREASVSMVQSRESLQGRDIPVEYVKERAQEYKRNWISQYNQTNGVRDTQSSLSTSTPTTAANNTRRNINNNSNNNNNNNNSTTNRRRTRNNSITSVSSELSQVQPMLSQQGSTSPPLFDDDVLLLDASPPPTAPNETSRSTTSTQALGGKRRRVLPGSSARKR
jgi:double-strand break repair protein MRE11